jgi:hypothetical protein
MHSRKGKRQSGRRESIGSWGTPRESRKGWSERKKPWEGLFAVQIPFFLIIKEKGPERKKSDFGSIYERGKFPRTNRVFLSLGRPGSCGRQYSLYSLKLKEKFLDKYIIFC